MSSAGLDRTPTTSSATETAPTGIPSIMAAPQGKPTSFFDLPPELRNTIYHLALPANQRIIISRKTCPKASTYGLLSIGGPIQDEANAIYFGSNTFYVLHAGTLREFLAFVGPERHHLIRRLELSTVRKFRSTREEMVVRVWWLVRDFFKFGGGGVLRPEPIFVAVQHPEDWVRVTEVPEFKIIEGQETWWIERRRAEASLRRIERHAAVF